MGRGSCSTGCHGHESLGAKSDKCCPKQFAFSGDEGTGHMCCEVHCCRPLTDEERREQEEFMKKTEAAAMQAAPKEREFNGDPDGAHDGCINAARNA